MFTSRIHQNSYLPGEGIYRLVAIADIWRQQVAWTHFVSINESLKQSLNITSLKLGRKRTYLFAASDKQSNLLPLPRNSLSMKTEKRKISIRTGKTTCVKAVKVNNMINFGGASPFWVEQIDIQGLLISCLMKNMFGVKEKIAVEW